MKPAELVNSTTERLIERERELKRRFERQLCNVSFYSELLLRTLNFSLTLGTIELNAVELTIEHNIQHEY